MNIKNFLERIHHFLLSDSSRHFLERRIILLAIIFFIVHLGLILTPGSGFNNVNPIAAIYTPFSFILLYEVYLLVFYLPHSISIYIGKQYEIVTLIVIRRLFKDLSNLELSTHWFNSQYDLQFTYDLIATIVLFFLIMVFYRLNGQQEKWNSGQDEKLKKFIFQKKVIAICLLPMVLLITILNFNKFFQGLSDMNEVFFDQFFTVLILTDVLLLLISMMNTDNFSKVVRNSGFIISTILIRISFGIEGILNPILLIVAVVFGVAILFVHSQYLKIPAIPEKLT
jgi:hypothetical protein